MEIQPDSRKRGTGKTVLIVDDNAAIRKLLVTAFSLDGFEICGQAANGQEGIEIAKRIKPDVIILDLSMPVMNGLEAASELRKIFPKMPIILFTLYADSISRREATKAGVNLVLLKAVPPSVVIDEAHKLIGRHH
jgi:DNA-binding NarL/FixJ family response regulator